MRYSDDEYGTVVTCDRCGRTVRGIERPDRAAEVQDWSVVEFLRDGEWVRRDLCGVCHENTWIRFTT